MSTIEQKFVADLLPRLSPAVVEALRADVREGRMEFAEDVDEWGPAGQTVKL